MNNQTGVLETALVIVVLVIVACVIALIVGPALMTAALP
jgi:hypothetical protein